ncbi:FAD-dependent monooxygenase [Nonomuraea sp. NPDC050556]|uniref:FAD-dependent monooxygenase n=1 Tax=Nonomuraea sp. NPDC050556 TaxID=3364369 RepID=UPI00378EF4E1
MDEVIVVGAGPTGLLLAGDLAEAGVKVTVLERRDGDVSNMSRAFGVHARTLEVLDARGLADELETTSVAHVQNARLFDKVHVDFGKLKSRFPYLLITAQYNVERVLLERAVKAGVTFVYGAEVTGLTQDAEGVTVELKDAPSRRAAYVVGADGIKSAVRKALGSPYPGRSVLKSIMLADVQLSETPPDTLTVNGHGSEFAFLAPFGDGWWRIFCWDRTRDVPDDAPIELDEIREVTRRALGSDFGMHDARWMSRFHSDERQVPEYRIGRVFLAGDAAHCHSPAGGMGMNTGLQDAANLSWKLVSVLRGAPDELLDTYQAERHPIGKEVVRLSGTIIRLAMIQSPVLRWVRGLVGGLVSRIPAVQKQMLGRMSGVGFTYPGHPRAADVDLPDGTRLYEALRGGHFVLLTEGTPEITDDRLTVKRVPGPTTLVRPDGYTADPATLRTLLGRS